MLLYFQVKLLEACACGTRRMLVAKQFELSKDELKDMLESLMSQSRAISLYYMSKAFEDPSDSTLSDAFKHCQNYDNDRVMAEMMCRRHGLKNVSYERLNMELS